MKKIVLITLFFYYTFANAQISFEKGYFISNDGKKIECYIKNSDWINTPTNFKYKMQLNDSEIKTESIETVQEFNIDNEYKYKRFKIKVDHSNDDLKELPRDRNPNWKEETIFLKVLIEGGAILYSYTEGNTNKFFYSTKTIPAEQLVHVTYLREDGENTSENNQYKKQLLNNVKSSNITEKEIQKVTYKKSDLIDYFIKYNNINPVSSEMKEAKSNKKLFFVKITPGVSIVSSSAKDYGDSKFNFQFDNKLVFKIGAEAEYIFPFNKNKWSLFVNPTYQKYQNEKNYTAPSGSIIENPEIPYNVKVNYSSVQLPIGVRHYMFLNQNSKIFIDAIYSFEINGNTKITYTNLTPGSTSVGSLESRSDTNLAFGLGYNFKNKFTVEARLNTKKELMNYSNYSARYNAIDFIFGYTIF
ncbi:outer membrane beta-barrel protein [uncultured Flavobacterium sp.]|uniref:outer membrane beta-barrel protein n=1 Tax=uncultured Flavobacterium sp. TaxID=165435 RepID=UPI0029317E74|nr:outer membrane beta-barrel protein [uncultured Flavobacterium sp.]